MAGRDTPSNLGCEEIGDWFTKKRKGSDTGQEASRRKEELEKKKEQDLRDGSIKFSNAVLASNPAASLGGSKREQPGK